MAKSEVDKHRDEACVLLKKTENKALRIIDCWNCTPSHAGLKKSEDLIIGCFICKHQFFKGVDITIGKPE